MTPQTLPDLLKEDLSVILKRLNKEQFSSCFLELPREAQLESISLIRKYFKNYDILNQELDKFNEYLQADQEKIMHVIYDILVKEASNKKTK